MRRGAQLAFASENATTSPVGLADGPILRRHLAAALAVDQAHAWLAIRNRCTISFVRSVEASEATTISSPLGG